MPRTDPKKTARNHPDGAITHCPSSSVHQQQTSPDQCDYDLWNQRIERKAAPIATERTAREARTEYVPYHPDASYLPPATQLELDFRHSGWHNQREKVKAAMTRLFLPATRKEKFDNCGSAAWIQRSPSTKRIRLVANYCGDRLCVPCALARATRIRQAILSRATNRELRFITLTLRHTDAPLTEQLDHLYKSFSKLRATKAWKRAVSAGAALLELKVNETTNQWHPHLHVIVAGRWIDQRELKEAWCKATNGSTIVDVRYVHEHRDAARYVTKYATKPIPAELYANEQRLDEAIIALKGRRTYLTFGTWHDVAKDDGPPQPKDWIAVCSLEAAKEAAARGEQWALALLAQLTRKTPDEIAQDEANGQWPDPDG